MTIRQKLLSAFYPIYKRLAAFAGIHSRIKSHIKTAPVSFYSLQSVLNNGDNFSFEMLRGKKVIIVNTASDCIYTAQYENLEKLFAENKNKLVIIGFPTNEFKKQENKNDQQIAEFCKINYGVTFPIMKKSSVLKNAHQHEVFQWLTDKNKNGWNDDQPTWNFCKYVIDEEGRLNYFFESAVEPKDEKFIKSIS